jgi:phospholipid/cholesterol/gamma-HCH transport system ATP-binding protein
MSAIWQHEGPARDDPRRARERRPDRQPDGRLDGRNSEAALPIDVQDLVVAYDDKTVLDGIDLTVRPREIMVVMGGSGSGKSTLLRAILGLLVPKSGTIRLFGQNFFGLAPVGRTKLRARMGVAFQSGALFSSLSVMENVILPLRQHTRMKHRERQDRAERVLAAVNMADAAHQMPSQLSGGMLKRAALARAIVLQPDLLFCDEPSAGLDPSTAAQIDELIMSLRDTLGATVVVVTHELESAFKIADRMCVLNRGQMVAVGNVDEVRASHDPYVQGLLNRRLEAVGFDPNALFADEQAELQRAPAGWTGSD